METEAPGRGRFQCSSAVREVLHRCRECLLLHATRQPLSGNEELDAPYFPSVAVGVPPTRNLLQWLI